MTGSIQQRLRSVNWEQLAESLWNDGYALTPALLSASECGELVKLYEENSNFRSRIIMARLGFGRGEYKYFKYPLPRIVAELRKGAYPRLAAIANHWAKEIGVPGFPTSHASFLKICKKAGQHKPTPLLLKYEVGDYNCLHQDLYGEVAFPFQMTFFLSRSETDYSGGEFVLVEQRPRMQSRVMVVTAQRGQAVIFATRHRPVRGTHEVYKTNLRHGVSPLRSGIRLTLGIIFHDAK